MKTGVHIIFQLNKPIFPPDMPFHKPLLHVRVQAWNKAVGGDFSDTLVLKTYAYSFKLDPKACHGSVKVTGDYSAEWDPSAVKGGC